MNSDKSPKLPNLFKYLPLNKDRIHDLINYGIYAATINQLNDPYEQIGIEGVERYRVVCLTRSWNKRILWAYFANGPGCCVGIDVKRDKDSLFSQVVYDNISDFKDIRQHNEPSLSLLHKDKKFQEEKEYRAIYDHSKPIDTSHWFINSDGRVFYKAKISVIYFAPYSDSQEDYKPVLNEIQKYNYNQKFSKDRITVKKYILDDKKYLFRLDNSFEL